MKQIYVVYSLKCYRKLKKKYFNFVIDVASLGQNAIKIVKFMIEAITSKPNQLYLIVYCENIK